MKPKKVKNGTIDNTFALALKESYDWVCQMPHCPYCWNVSLRHAGGLECAHGHGRRQLGGRWHPDNCLALCHDAHTYLDSHPIEKWDTWRRLLGDTRYELLRDRMRLTFKYSPAERAEINVHYRAERKRIWEMRMDGVQGPVELVPWDNAPEGM